MMLREQVRRWVPDAVLQRYRDHQLRRGLPATATWQDAVDRQGLPFDDPGCERAISANLAWLARAQDCSITSDGGVARHFSLIDGWAASYPETTGYIVPTMLVEAEIRGDDSLSQRAERMLDWLVGIQFPEGGFQGGVVTQKPAMPVTFNTGQILLGLAAGARSAGTNPTGDNPTKDAAYLDGMHRAARWLVETMDDDGCWRRFATPFAAPGEKTYETHVAWGLFEADRVAPGEGYGEAGMKQVRWALGKQLDNGWLRDCCLGDPERPLTHTIGYALRGFLEAYRLSGDHACLDAARRTAEGLLPNLREDGFLPGRFDSSWHPAVDWACLTGSVQIAFCWFQLFEFTGETRYREAGQRVNAYVRRTLALNGDPDLIGGVRGAFPISGAYGSYEYLNWAAKFCIDSLRKEQELDHVQVNRAGLS